VWRTDGREGVQGTERPTRRLLQELRQEIREMRIINYNNVIKKYCSQQ
jgi:hypothetical protein